MSALKPVEQQEPTPIHPVTESPAHVPFESAEGATPAAEWSVDAGATEHPPAPCDHDWRTENVSPDRETGLYKSECAKCGEKRVHVFDGAGNAHSTRVSPPPKAPDLMADIPWTKGPEPPGPQPLTATERSAFLGLQAQARQYEQAINEQERAIVAEIEARMGLDVGAIGVSHTVNAQTWQVVAMPQQDGNASE